MGELGVTVSMSERGYYDCIAIGDHVPNSYAVLTLFGVDWLLLIIVARSWSSRCLNYRIDVPDKIGSISSCAITSMVVKNGTKKNF